MTATSHQLTPTTLPEGIYTVRLDANNAAVIEPGEVHFEDGSRYSGGMAAGQRNGFGTLRFADGGVFEGEWRKDRREGKGVFTWPSGKHKYSGTWRDDVPNGVGTEALDDGSTYTGQYSAGKMHGKGTLRYPDGALYEGQFADDGPCGEGKLTYATGDTVQCATWATGLKKHGTCTLTYAATQKVYVGTFDADTLVGTLNPVS